MNKVSFILLLFFLTIKPLAEAQNTNNYWQFGYNAGIYFDNLGAHPMKTNVLVAEGTASISDGCGLLFYTDGDSVWDKNSKMMKNGFNIGAKCIRYGMSSSTMAALIVRQPANDSIFYIFTTDCIEDTLVDGLRYSIVNMNRNGGQGEVILKNQPLLAYAEEKLTASKHSNGCDIWIISHKYKTNNFYSFLLSSSGLNTTPIISSTGQIHTIYDETKPPFANARGYLKASPNGQKLISVSLDGAYSGTDTTLPELFNFNRSNGLVTSDFVFPIDTSDWWPHYCCYPWSKPALTMPFYGATFSPDNSKLYLSSGFYGPNIYQYDLNAGTPAKIAASKILLGSKSFLVKPYNPKRIPVSLLNAPDGKLYVTYASKTFLGRIDNPNFAGLTCGYNDSALNLVKGTQCHWGGLPNFFEYYINPKILEAKFLYSQHCDAISFENKSIAASNFTWYFGDGTISHLKNPTHIYPKEGYYNVSLFAKDSSCDVDKFCQTIYVSLTKKVETTINKLICEADSFVFFDSTLRQAGIYKHHTMLSSGCDSITILNLTISPKPNLPAIMDTLICEGDLIDFDFLGPGIKQLFLNKQMISKKFSLGADSNYIIQFIDSNNCISNLDTFNIAFENCDSVFLKISNVFTPGNDGFNDFFDIIIDGEIYYNLSIYNRWGQLVFKQNSDAETQSGNNWNGRINNKGAVCPEGTYFYIFEYRFKNRELKRVNGTLSLIR